MRGFHHVCIINIDTVEFTWIDRFYSRFVFAAKSIIKKHLMFSYSKTIWRVERERRNGRES